MGMETWILTMLVVIAFELIIGFYNILHKLDSIHALIWQQQQEPTDLSEVTGAIIDATSKIMGAIEKGQPSDYSPDDHLS